MNWQPLQLPLLTGVDTKGDVRAGNPPGLEICRDVQFDEPGGLQTRHPITTFGNNIVGGGTLSNCRRIERNGDELVLFTDTQLYSWSAQASAWVLRGTHMAVAVDEGQRCATPGDQIDGDRAELNNVVVFTWAESTTVYAAALDKTTNAIVVAPTALSSAQRRPRVVALATRILLFVDAGGNNLTVRSIDPASPGIGIAGAGTNVAAGTLNTLYDVVKVEGQDLCAGAHLLTPSTSYRVFTVTPGLVVTGVTKPRTCNSPIAVASTLGTGTQLQIIRENLTAVQGDLLTTSTLADVFVNQPIGTAASSLINQVTVAFANATTAVAFWTSGAGGEASDFTDFTIKTNTVTTANVVGTESVLRRRIGIASRAFTYSGHAYIWTVFAGESGTSSLGNTSGVRAQLQNTYFLYRDDALLISRAADDVAGGFAPSLGRLPGVQLISGSTGFAWCGAVRRTIELGATAEHTGFGARSLREIKFAFDDNRARRCARIGQTLYISGGIPLQYDGLSLTEVGFLVYPWYFEPQVGAAGNLGAGTYTWKATNRWTNAQGEVDRSTTATGMSLTVAASKFVFLNYLPLHVTMKLSPRPPALDMWRTVANAGFDSPFYLVTSQDPNAGIVDNGYVVNDDTQIFGTPLPDNFADATLTVKEVNPENGSVLEFLAPPGAQIMIATDTRIFLAGVSGDPDSIWPSRIRNVGEVASFHDSLTVPVPPDGSSPITAIAFLNETLVAFRGTSIYALPGVGFDNTGGGSNFGPANRLSSDVGAISHESVALTPLGLIFKSRKGWYLLDRSWGVRYIGAQVSAFDSDTVLAVHVVEAQHQVRILTNARMLVWDYVAVSEQAQLGSWSEWTISDGVHATVWNGSYLYLTATGPKIERSTFTGTNYGMDMETMWIKFADLQGAARVRWLELLGEVRAAGYVRIRVARDYIYDGSGDPVYFDDRLWPVTPVTVGSALQVRHGLTQQNMQAIKVRVTAVDVGTTATLNTNGGLDGAIVTSGAPLAMVFQPRVFTDLTLGGAAGNALSMSFGFEQAAAGEAFSFDVRDHFLFDPVTGRWRERVNNVGVRVRLRTGSSPTTSDFNVVQDTTTLIQIQSADGGAVRTINAATMIGQLLFGQLTGGTYIAPTGEAIKLTGLGFDVGLRPGLNRRLPATQKA